MTEPAPVLLLVESDIVVRHPLAQYLRECGFVVFEAANGQEAIRALSITAIPIAVMLADVESAGNGFALSQWVRVHQPQVEVILAASVARTLEHAGTLCNEGPAASKPYEHRLVLEQIRAAIARRDRGAAVA